MIPINKDKNIKNLSRTHTRYNKYNKDNKKHKDNKTNKTNQTKSNQTKQINKKYIKDNQTNKKNKIHTYYKNDRFIETIIDHILTAVIQKSSIELSKDSLLKTKNIQSISEKFQKHFISHLKTAKEKGRVEAEEQLLDGGSLSIGEMQSILSDLVRSKETSDTAKARFLDLQAKLSGFYSNAESVNIDFKTMDYSHSLQDEVKKLNEVIYQKTQELEDIKARIQDYSVM